MGDVGEDMRVMHDVLREESKARRANNRDKGPEHLRAAGISFVSKNNGAHLIVAERWDFWPGTGLWKDRLTPTQGRGVRNLVRAIEQAGAA